MSHDSASGYNELRSVASVSTISCDDNDFDTLSCVLDGDFDELTSEELVEAQIQMNKAVGAEIAKVSKVSSAELSAPRVLKNDIRRFFSNMFMNTVNSADFHRTEDFFRTFMASQCTFASQQVLAPEFRVPTALQAVGPRLFSHYLLGCFIMYPDMVLSMADTKIITSSSWAGTKIVMQVEYRLTKTYDIPVECWVPPAPALEKLYSETSLEGMMEAIRLTPKEESLSGATINVSQSSAPKKPDSPRTRRRKRRRKNYVDPAAATYIPAEYIKNLQSSAVMMNKPHKLHVKGEFVLYLDEHHQIQHAVLRGRQLPV